jgi:hypothetical protein
MISQQEGIMNKNSLVIATFVAVGLLSACGTPAPPQADSVATPPKKVAGTVGAKSNPTCSGPPVHVTINQVTISGSRATIKINPKEAPFPKTGAGIRWNFSGNQYSFTGDGISFVKSGYPQQPFGPIDYGYGNNATEFVVCFGDTSSVGPATWHYDIKFFANSDPSVVWVCDPTLVNSAGEPGAPEPVDCVKQ